VPTKGSKRRAFRYDDDEWWAQFIHVAGEGGASDLLRQFVEYWAGKPGAKMPRRPKS
jgi:hypothetical protein